MTEDSNSSPAPTPAGIRNASPAEGYPVRVATRVTGLKAELLRAWESRYEAIRPSRTPGGARRYSAADLDRLSLLRQVVESGHRIGSVAHLRNDELAALLSSDGKTHDSMERAIDAAQRLDGAEARRWIEAEQAARDSLEFATQFAAPLLVEVGRRWERGEVSVSAEHLISGILRGILTDLVARSAADGVAPDLVFSTLPGELHDLGTLLAALVAARSGAGLSFVGADVPIPDLADQMIASGASTLVVGVLSLPTDRAREGLFEIRARLPRRIGIWIGGAGIERLAPIDGVDRIENFRQLEAHVARLGLARFGPQSAPAPAFRGAGEGGPR